MSCKINLRHTGACLLAACAMAAPGIGHAAPQTVILYGDDDYAPYSYVENGVFKGMYVDILRLAASAMPDYQLELQPRPWKRGLAALEKGQVFGLFPPGRKTQRPYVQPYSAMLYRESVVLFCHDAVMRTPRTRFPADFAGLTIGVNTGFLLSEKLMAPAREGLLRLEAAKGNEANLKKLALRRIDCYASDRGAARHTARQLGAELASYGFQLHEVLELSSEATYIAYSARNTPAYKADFIQKMNAALLAMRQNGELARIEGAYLP
ncbi:substrate-binding periplasmic protein [Janthinobacterium lividum]|uniref:substrate-binding periplasmic protein n=1 Tax=Janthinobacterium lividum TaxID=29581 RepID=UPI000893B022|nr:transporter substrate-binding domain-containing protein [Janthinobacterium lividum]OEZ51069.1 bacterial extracellular solute-binding protein, family 3 [Janthinobacterium lividum]WQE29622.1 transporter substrate-binding domain-containing protein [Janthinobacterium lividum]STQ95105.1 lysine-arginine-ornithine-binding periplasmic protein [Janthinobacterium lividum]